MIKYLSNEDYEKEVLNSDKPVFIDFFATWCGPCHMLSPIVNELSEEYENYKFFKVDVDVENDLAYKFKISSIPTIVIIKNGETKITSIGYRSKEELRKILDENK